MAKATNQKELTGNASPIGAQRSLPQPRVLHETAHSGSKLPSNRSFGFTVGAILLLIAIYIVWRNGWGLAWLCIPGAGLIATAAFAPIALQPLNRMWMALGLLLGKLVTPVVMFLVYALAIVPIGLIMRLVGKQPLNLRKQTGTSYWIERQPPGPSPESLEDQF